MKTLKHRYTVLSIIMIFYMVFFQFGSSILMESGASLYQNQSVAMSITGILGVLLSAMFLSSFPRANVTHRPFGILQFVFYVLIIYGLQTISGLLMEPLISFLNAHGYAMEELTEASSGKIQDFPDIVYGIVIAPLLEEIFFRELVYKMVRPAGVFTAGIMMGLFFGLSHMNLIQFMPAFLIGILLFQIRDRYGLPFSILMHVTNNLLVVLIYNYSDTVRFFSYLAAFLVIIGISVTLISMLLNLPKLFRLVQSERTIIGPSFRAFFSTPMMDVFLILTLAMTVLSITYG